ncbi:hypothetical protein [Aquimarina brevivitae]|uniref:Lipoprotein n=1 Tax=Aquimarina brevivitae TaxID=323412 RepID=A0A4V2F7H4_9FLAO|nr:hypothetical protein [Aquimarina brevivitae]RZS99829.1 hypothetical protein EV197_1057 [Aquimarina brevivitae]
MKAKLHALLYTISLLTFLTSCSGNSATASVTSPEGISVLKEKLSETFDKDKQIDGLVFFSNNSTVDAIEQINISFPENNRSTMWFYSYATEKLHKPEAQQILQQMPKTKALEEFNIDKCYTYFKEAVKLIEKETDEFSNYRIDSYAMSVNPTSGNIEHSLTLNTDKKSLKRTFYGKKVNDRLYRFKFKTNEEDVLIATEGLDAFKDE